MKFVQPIRDVEKIKEMFNYLPSERDKFLWFLGINVGVRVSDLLQLQVKDVKDKTHICIKESKTNKTKRFPLNSGVRTKVEKYVEGKNENDWLFPSRKGDKPISRVQAYRILNKAAQEIGLEEIGTHTMRKTFGYHFYKKTHDIALLQDILNHSAPSVTLRYIGINQDMIDEVIEHFDVFDLDN